MTKDEFAAECLKLGIDPVFAIEHEDIVAALTARDYQAVLTALRENF